MSDPATSFQFPKEYKEFHVLIATVVIKILVPGESPEFVDDAARKYADARCQMKGNLYDIYSEAFNDVRSKVIDPNEDSAKRSFQGKMNNLKARVDALLTSNNETDNEKKCIEDFQKLSSCFGSYIPDERFWLDHKQAAILKNTRIIRSANLQSEEDTNNAFAAMKSLLSCGTPYLAKFLFDYAWYGTLILNDLENPSLADLEKLAILIKNHYGCGPFGTVLEQYLVKIGVISG